MTNARCQHRCATIATVIVEIVVAIGCSHDLTVFAVGLRAIVELTVKKIWANSELKEARALRVGKCIRYIMMAYI